MTEKRFNCHVKFSAMPNGIMVLDYERHGDEQTVIEDINREKAHRVMDRLNELNDENEQLKNQIDELEDDNEKYSKSLNKLEDYTKRFIPTKCLNEFKDCKTNRYYWLDHEGNLEGALELLNLMDCENEQLKQFKEDVFNKIDMHLRMLPTARDNEFNEYDGDPSLYTGAIYILETLKKELSE